MSSDLTLLPVEGAPAAGLTDALTSAVGYALSEKADATRRAYRADIRRFSTWCESVGAIAPLATVAAHLAALADLRLKVSTISRRVAAIAYARKLAGFEPPIENRLNPTHLVLRCSCEARASKDAPGRAAGSAAQLTRLALDPSSQAPRALRNLRACRPPSSPSTSL